MPSAAFSEYKKNLKDVHRLVLLHRHLSGAGQGRRGLGHLTRGGLLLLCAAWERYTETVLPVGARKLASRLPSYNALPATPRQKVVDHVNDNSTHWTAADLNGPRWADIYAESMISRIERLHTPKHYKLKPLFEDFLAVPDIGTAWSTGAVIIDGFVTLRGEVAHRGGQSTYIKFGRLVKYEKIITRYVRETDNFLSDHLRTLVQPNVRPWNRIV